MMKVTIVNGDLLDQKTEAIVNPWNRNIFPWWLLLPHGVSGAIKKRGGIELFRELSRKGPIPLGGAVYTAAGNLPYRSIIHVASISLWWRSSKPIIQDAVKSAMSIAEQLGLHSIAFPILGAGSGGLDSENAENIMIQTFAELSNDIAVVIVRYSKPI